MLTVRKLLPVLILLLISPLVHAQPEWDWKYSDTCMVFSMAVNDRGYVATGFGYDVILISPTGKRVYKVPSRDFAYSIAISENNYVLAGTRGFYVQLFDPHGKLAFEYKTGNQVWAVAISPDAEEFVAGSNDGWLYFFRGKKVVWKADTGAPIWGVYLGREVYAGNDAGLVVAYSLNGTRLWEKNLGGRVWRLKSDGKHIAALVLHTGQGVTSDVYLLDGNGIVLWSRHFDDYVRDVSIHDGRVAVSGDIGSIDLFSLNGTQIYQFPAFSPFWDVATRRGYVLAGGGGRDAVLLSPNGTPVWYFQDNRSVSVVAMSPSGRYLAVADRTFQTVNCQGTVYFQTLFKGSGGTSSTATNTTETSPSFSSSPSAGQTTSSTTQTPTPHNSSESGKGLSGHAAEIGLGLAALILIALLWREIRE
ncbi:hypothetical protein [Thermococcus sp.]|uniref:WD40 repeat domain-containing protein n=1 Tax=Thermococcus sp. TaxID=35749 RepID=UPI00261721F4|nr:hypothetical protein [Thermococcus sp.]